MTVKRLKTTKNLDLSKFVDSETGELMLDNLNSGTSVQVSTPNEDLVLFHSDSFITLEVEALELLVSKKIITTSDLGKLLVLAKTLRTEYNAMYQKSNQPHTLETITTLLDTTYDYTTRFLKKLYHKNIVHRYVTVQGTLYCLNPYLTRRRKTISKELLKIFSEFKK